MAKKKTKRGLKRLLPGKAKERALAMKERVLAQPEEVTLADAPRITNENVGEHREEVLSVARRFIYPLQHSKHRIVLISVSLVALVVITTSVLTALLLYRYQSTGDLTYRVTQIIPFPVAKVDGHWVSYEDYLFELRSGIHYQQTKENVDFGNEDGAKVMQSLKERSLQKVKLNALAAQAARDKGVKVSSEEVDARIESIRGEGGLTMDALRSIVREYYDWDLTDLRKDIATDILWEKLPAALDTKAAEEAATVHKALKGGANFGRLAKRYSDDEQSKDDKGELGVIERSDKNLPPAFIEAAFDLKRGELSEPITVPYGIHIIKVLRNQGKNKVVAHILFRYQDVTEYLEQELAQTQVKDYIKL